MSGPALVLASKSPRRRQLMEWVAPRFALAEADVDERGVTAESPALLAAALARLKAQAVYAARPGDVVVGCDTVVELEGEALGKPRGQQEAAEMLRALAGRRHRVHTGVCIYAPGGGAPTEWVETTAVDFAAIPEAEILAYVQTDEPYDKAGGYAIQGWAARYIPRIEGCYYNVMGLPVAALHRALHSLPACAPLLGP